MDSEISRMKERAENGEPMITTEESKDIIKDALLIMSLEEFANVIELYERALAELDEWFSKANPPISSGQRFMMLMDAIDKHQHKFRNISDLPVAIAEVQKTIIDGLVIIDH